MRMRNACFTSYKERIEPKADENYLVYCVWQQERCPETGRLHYQGYAEFSKPISMRQAQKAIGDPVAHIKTRYGTQKEAITYCTKEETRVAGPWSVGEAKKQGSRTDIQAIANMARDNVPIAEIVDEIPNALRYTRNIREIKYEYGRERAKKRKHWPCFVRVLWGETGTGKTSAALEYPASFFKWNPTKGAYWMDGYDGETHLIIDDYQDQIPIQSFLNILDDYSCQIPVKGGFVWRGWDMITITSNYPPEEWYRLDDGKSTIKEPTRDAMMRRIDLIQSM